MVSIIIATYNAELFISRALDSVISLKNNNWECLVIDGLSSDATIDIVQKYVEKDPRISYLSEKDKGIYDAFNKGWKNAKGEWIYYLGSDDILTEDGLNDLMLLAKNAASGVGVINGGVYRKTVDGRIRKVLSNGFIGSHQGMIMRRTAIQELGGFNTDYKIIADYDLFIRMKCSHWDVVNCNSLVAYFNSGGASENFSTLRVVFREKYKILQGDPTCKYPFLITFNDTARTVLGALLHRFLKIIK